MNRTIVLTVAILMTITGVLAVAAAPLSGSWSSSIQSDVNPFSITSIESVLVVDYSVSGWTVSSTAIADLNGLGDVYLDARGVLGGFAIRSITDFDAEEAQFQSIIGSAVTAIAGVNLYGLFMLDNVGSIQAPSIGSGLTIGGWAEAGDLSIWAQTRFNMNDTSGYIYKYGYKWLLDHFIFKVCDTWQVPSGYIDVQTAGCTACWSGADIYVESPFACVDLLAELSLSRAGFEHALFEINNVDFGIAWLDVKWVDLLFTTTSKSMNLVFDVNVGDTACITPYLALEGSGTQISGLSLKALKLSSSWDNITFKAGDLFDENGWYPYLNYVGTRYYGWTWDGELATLPICAVAEGYDEYLALEVTGDSCCGGDYKFTTFAWFDTGNSIGLFDWSETRAKFSVGLGSNLSISFGMSVTQAGTNWFKLETVVLW